MKGEKGTLCAFLYPIFTLMKAEFSGTLLGFDDYVSKYHTAHPVPKLHLMYVADMVLEDVTEL